MAQDTTSTQGARSLRDAVAEIAPGLDARRVADVPNPKRPGGAPPPLPGTTAVAPPALAGATLTALLSETAKAPLPGIATSSKPAAPEAARPTSLISALGEMAPLAAPVAAAPALTVAPPSVVKRATAPAQAQPLSPVSPPVGPAPPYVLARPVVVTAPVSSAATTAATETRSVAQQSVAQQSVAQQSVRAPPVAALAPLKPQASAQSAPAAKIDADLEADDPPAPADGRRAGQRRTAGPARGAVAANDDSPTIGGLIFALQQKPSRRPFVVAAALSGTWFVLSLFFAWAMIAPELARSSGIGELFARPVLLTVFATIVLPMTLFWFLAWLLYQAQDLRLRSSAMTEVAIRLAEPDRNAENAVASLGQTVRRQINHMNDAISQAIGRAGELEAMVHNEVATLDQSFAGNEARIRRVLEELANERNQLTGTSEQVHTTLRSIGDEVPALIEKLNGQQLKLARIIENAGQNLIALESGLVQASGQLEGTLGERTVALKAVLTDNTGELQKVLVDRTSHLQTVLDEYTTALHESLGARTGQFQSVFEDFTLAIDATLAARSDQMGEAFSARLQVFDHSISQSTLAIDQTVGEKARLLSVAMETHAKQLADTLGRQSQNLDETLIQGINAVRRTSENITRQSVKAIEGLSGQADMLKNVSENLLGQINTVTSRFENQGQSILRAANSLETANQRIDQTLQNRHRELNDTLGRVTESTDQLGQQMLTYRSTIEGSLTDAQGRAQAMADDLSRGAQSHAQSALHELQRLRTDTDQEANRTLASLRDQVSHVSREMSDHMGSLSNHLTQTSDELRTRARTASEQLARDQEHLRATAQRMPEMARDSTEQMRRALAEQMHALEQVAAIAGREAMARDVAPPLPLQPQRMVGRDVRPAMTPSLTAALAGEVQRQQQGQGNVATGAASGWSLGDLLARASHVEVGHVTAEPVSYQPQPAGGASVNLEQIASALDPQTAAAIWARFRSGQRGILVRSIYTADGRATFDDVTRRYAADQNFHMMVDRFLADFERELREIEAQDRTGQALQAHLVSGSGRVYLFLAHASGRMN